MTIYISIIPTYLCIKQHSITKKKYFCKTTRPDPLNYLGSGTYWKDHIKKHGKQFVKTIWLSDLYYDTSISEHALHFSYENNIVESDEWANLKPENGLDGALSGIKQSVETCSKKSISTKGISRGPKSEDHKANISAAQKGKSKNPHHQETKDKISKGNTGKIRSDETKAKMSAWQKGKIRGPRSDEQKAKIAATKAANLLILQQMVIVQELIVSYPEDI